MPEEKELEQEENKQTKEKKPKKEKPPKKEKVPKPEKPPKPEKQAKKDDQDEHKKVNVGLISLALAFLIIGVFIALVKLDVGGLGSRILGPSLKNVPVINMILPKMPEASEEAVASYNFASIDEAVERLKATEILLKEKEKEAEKLNETIKQNKTEIDRLKIFETSQLQFAKDKEEFDRLVAQQADKEAYMKYVEETYPESALKIYGELIKEKAINDEVEKIAKMFQEMKPKNAAAILEETIAKDIDMAAEVLFKLDSAQSGAVLAAMDPIIADKISRYMYPENY